MTVAETIEAARRALDLAHNRIEQLERENAAIRKDAERYYWLVANRKCWSWHPSAYNKEVTSGFAAYNTGYLGFDFEPAIDEAMMAEREKRGL